MYTQYLLIRFLAPLVVPVLEKKKMPLRENWVLLYLFHDGHDVDDDSLRQLRLGQSQNVLEFVEALVRLGRDAREVSVRGRVANVLDHVASTLTYSQHHVTDQNNEKKKREA